MLAMTSIVSQMRDDPANSLCFTGEDTEANGNEPVAQSHEISRRQNQDLNLNLFPRHKCSLLYALLSAVGLITPFISTLLFIGK